MSEAGSCPLFAEFEMPLSRLRLAAASTALLTAACAAPAAQAATPAPPPAGAAFDYQIGGAYDPPEGVKVVTRDHGTAPAKGLYNICYVNAFQAQPGAEGEWDDDLLLRDASGNVVMDGDWGEALLDVGTAGKRTRIAAKVDSWIDECAAKGYQAVEPDNFDSFTRSDGLLTDADAQDYIKLLSAHAHEKGLAIAQKNTSELSARHTQNGLDFAVAEECGEQHNCGEFTAAFGDHVIVIEYTAEGLSYACGHWPRLSIVRRDHDVVTPDDAENYVRETC